MPLELEDLEPTKRELVRSLLRGASPEDLGWALAETPERVVELSREALVELDPRLAALLDEADRRRVADYMLRRQSPGQAAGTWEVLDRSPDARRFAVALRESLAEAYGDDRPAIPRVDDAPSPPERTRGPSREHDGQLAARRRRRERRREIEQLMAAAIEMQSPFRHEAIDAYREGRDANKLPHFASRPVRYSLYALLSFLLLGLVLSVLVKIPTFSDASVMVVDLPEGSAGPVRGLGMVALFPSEEADRLTRGQSLSVRLPDTRERATSELRYVSRRVLSPREIVSRFRLPQAQANRVVGPAAVAVAQLRTPADAPPRAKFEGAVTTEADARTGSRRVISLVKP